jgi:hypothetical protein
MKRAYFTGITIISLLLALWAACSLEGDIEVLRQKPVENPGLSAPSAPVLTASNGQITATWTAVQGATAYEVWVGTVNNPNTATKRGNDVSDLFAVITSLTNGTTYYVWIKAKNSVGVSGFSPSTSGTPITSVVVPQIPATPTVSTSNGQITVIWAAVSGATSYEVYYSTNTTIPTSPPFTVTGLNTTITGLANGTTYYFWVKAVNANGTSAASPMASGVPIGTPGNLTIIAANQQLTVSWATVSGATSYGIYYSTNTTIPASPAYTVTDLSRTFTGLTNGTTYYFWVKAVNANGTSAASPMASGKPIGNMGTVTVNVGESGQLVLSWSVVAGTDQYEVYCSTNDSIPATPAQTVSVTTATISSLTNGTTYYVWVKPKNANGTGETSAVASGVPIATPSNLTMSAANQQITVSWAAAEGANSYEVYYSANAAIPASPSHTGTDLSRTFTGLTNGTMYYFWVKAVNAIGASAASPMASGKPIANMGVVTLVPGNGQLTASWAAVAGADQYEVYYSTNNSIPATPAQTVNAPVTTATISSLTNGTMYYVWVKPKNANGAGETSAVVSGVPLATPGNLTLSAANQQITVSWTAVTGATSYEVYYSTNTTIPAAPSFTVTTTSRTFTGLTNGTTYYFWVKAVNATGAGAASPMASGKPIGNMGTVTVNVGESGQLVLSWSAVAGADEYEVYYSTNNSIQATPAQTVSVTTATINSLTNGTTYYVWVKPRNANGAGSVSTVANGVPTATPGNLTISAANQQITVSWAAVTGATSYEVYYSTNTTIPASSAYTGTDINRTFTGLTNGTTYYFWVKAVNANGAGAASPMANGKPIANMGAVTLVPGNGQLTASWTAVAGADQYEVYYSTNNSIPATPAQTVNAPATTATMSGLTNNTTYYVWVKPKNANGTGETSAVASGMPLTSPGNLTLSAANQQITVSWTAVTGATSYEVYYSTNTTIPASPSFTVTTTSRTITGLTNGTTYYFWVKAANATGTSAASPMASGKPVGNMGTVTLVSGNGQLTASWTAVAGADQYEVYYSTNNSIPASPAQTVNAPAATATMSGLTNNTTYYVWVKPKNANGAGETSAVASGTPTRIGLYKGSINDSNKIGSHNLSQALTYISANAVSGDNFYIVLGANESDPPSLGYSGKTVGITLIGDGGEKTITRTSNGSLFTINSGVTLTLDENVTLVGRSTNIASLVYLSSGNLIINAGAKISGNTIVNQPSSRTYGGGIYVSGGNLTMNGGEISGNTARGTQYYNEVGYGGGIYVSSGTVTINGGVISGNTAGGNDGGRGGGIYVSSGTVTINGGVISGNNVDNYYGTGVGGGIYGTVTINGGVISGNRANGGGGIYGTVTMHGGTISGNITHGAADFFTNPGVGGGIYGTLKKLPSNGGQNSGIIYGSEETGVDANGISLRNSGDAVYTSSTARRNTTAWQTDQIDTTTGRGLSASGEPPYGN